MNSIPLRYVILLVVLYASGMIYFGVDSQETTEFLDEDNETNSTNETSTASDWTTQSETRAPRPTRAPNNRPDNSNENNSSNVTSQSITITRPDDNNSSEPTQISTQEVTTRPQNSTGLETTVAPPKKVEAPFKALDKSVVFVAKSILKYMKNSQYKNDTYIALMSVKTDNYKSFMTLVDEQDSKFWEKKCSVTTEYRKFLEKDFAQAANESRESLNTFKQYKKVLSCKKDCNFDAIYKVPANNESSFSEEMKNKETFAKKLLASLNDKAAPACKTTIAKDIPAPKNAADIANNISK